VGLFQIVEDKDLMYQLKILKRELKAADQRVKNRRFVAMRGLLAAGEYFSDEQMKHRDPLLYEQVLLIISILYFILFKFVRHVSCSQINCLCISTFQHLYRWLADISQMMTSRVNLITF